MTFEEYCDENNIIGEDKTDFEAYLKRELSMDYDISTLNLSFVAFEEHYDNYVDDMDDEGDDF